MPASASSKSVCALSNTSSLMLYAVGILFLFALLYAMSSTRRPPPASKPKEPFCNAGACSLPPPPPLAG